MELNKQMTIMEVLGYCDQEAVISLLQGYGMHCIGCMVAHGETVEQAAYVHGIDSDELIAALQKCVVE